MNKDDVVIVVVLLNSRKSIQKVPMWRLSSRKVNRMKDQKRLPT